MKSTYIFILCVVLLALNLKNHYPRSSKFSSMIASGSFIVVHFTFSSVIRFELIFVKGVKSVSKLFLFLFLHINV